MSILKKTSSLLLVGFLSVLSWQSLPAMADAGASKPRSPVGENEDYCNQESCKDLKEARNLDQTQKATSPPSKSMGDQSSYPGGLGGFSQTQLAMETKPSTSGGMGSSYSSYKLVSYEADGFRSFYGPPQVWNYLTMAGAESGVDKAFEKAMRAIKPALFPTPGDAKLATGIYTTPGGDPKLPAKPAKANEVGAGAAAAAAKDQQTAGEPKQSSNNAKSNGQSKQSSAASSAGEDAIECMIQAFEGITQYLINVGNEEAGSPCAANQVTKTYENAVWMVQRMYKHCFLWMGVLFLLPGALMTNMKTFISFGFLHNANDEDAVSPFTGILRSVIAIFLIPFSQVVISYMVDVGNSLQTSCLPYISVPSIILWAEEQVQIFKPEQQGGLIHALPNIPKAPWRGKAAGMPGKGAVMEQISGLDSALSELANECMHVLAMGMNIAYAFQLVMICYLLCLGPLAGAFFAWPAAGRDLFRKAFASWVDGVVILSLWKFWWCVVLITMTLHVQEANPFDQFEVYYLAAFLCIIMFVPFNPFDFKPGEIVGHAMEKAQSVAAKVAQGGKGGGSGGGGGKGGGRPGPPGGG